MKIKFLAIFLLAGLATAFTASAQDFSNKGKEFWLAYCYHVGMVNAGGQPVMTLYLTSDVTTPYSVSIYGVTTVQSGTITAGQVVTVTIPNTYFINNEGTFTNKAIRVTADKPIVVYSYITRSAASGATLVLPTNVLGKEYYAMSFTQASNEANSNSYFTIIAVEDNTTIEITPTAATKNGWAANTTYTINLNKGQIYQVLGTTNGNNGVDLSGSKIKSIAGGQGGCKRIAVFSGSGKIRIPATCGQNSSDNLYQQLYPTGTWGLKFLTVPSFNRPNNYYRILISDPSTNVYLNGALLPIASFTNNYYQFQNNTPNSIQADKPISVTQYFTTQGCDGNGSPYDPDMIVLNPVEQNIDKVTLVSSNTVAAGPQHHIHVIMRNGGTGISSFTFDGAPPPGTWLSHPADPNYSYLYLSNVAQGYHRLSSDSGFNAIAYGYADAETYGYSAGANVKDLYQFVSVQNQYATVSFPAACKNSPFYFSMTFPYQPTQIQWQFNGLFPDVTLTNPTYSSTTTVNGKQLYKYELPNPYTITAVGTYPIKVVAQNPTSDGCSGEQEINYDLQVFERPQADFTFTSSGCLSDSVHFFDNANTNGRQAIRWAWDFGDNGSSLIRNPAHLYTSPGSYNVKYSVITDIGCVSDTAIKTVVISNPPVAKFGVSAPNCIGSTITFTDSSSVASGNLTKWYWNFGDGSPQVIATTNAPQTHAYATTGSFTVTLKVESSSGCQSQVFTKNITINPKPLASFTFGNACLPTGTMQFTDASSITDGSQAQFTYLWTFSDGGNSSLQNPTHNYTGTGPYTVTLQVTSNNGCIDDTVRTINTIYPQPQANFTAPAEVCVNATASFTDQSTATNSSVTQWQWNFGDNTSSTQQNPTHTYSTPGAYTVTLTITSAVGCVSTVATRTVLVPSLPTAKFGISSPNCTGKNITFTDSSTIATGTIVKWYWDFGDGSGQVIATTNAAQAHSYTNAGTYNVTLKVETAGGCQSPVYTLAVVVNPNPLASFNFGNACLPGGTMQFTNTSTISDGSQNLFTYLWTFSDGGSSNQQNPTHTYSSTGPFTATLQVTSNKGCVDDTVKTVNTIYAQPQAAFSAPAEVCFGTTVNFTDQSTAANSSITQWQWNFGDNTSSTAQNPTHNFAAAGTYTVTLTATSAIGCVSTVATKTVVVNALPVANFNASAPYCATKDITFTDASSSSNGTIVKWTWDLGDGSPVQVLTSNTPFTHAYPSTGTYVVTLKVESSKGCISTITTKNVVVHPLPVPSFTLPDNCVNDPIVQFTDNSTIADGSQASFSYLWNFGDANANAGNPNTSTTQNGQHRFVATGTYNVSLTVTSNNGCTASVTQPFTINGALPQSGFTVNGGNQICSNNTVSITNNSSVDFGRIIKLEIYWDYANDPTNKTVVNLPGSGAIFNHTYPEFFAPLTKNDQITVIAYSGTNCLSTSSQTITLKATPEIVFTPVNGICADVPSFQLSQASVINALPGIGVYSGTGVSSTGLFNPSAAGAGSHNIRYTYTGSNGCINYKEQSIAVFPVPVVDAGPDKFILQGGTAVLNGSASGVGLSYAWTPVTGLSNPSVVQPSVSPNDDITYTLTVTSSDGCTSSDQVFVKLLKTPAIPNTFSPNGDGVHDKWEIQYLESYPGCTVEIYNRYGQIVFQSKGYSRPWDGTLKGKDLPAGTYYYIIDPKNGRKQMAGFVDIIR